MAFREETFGVVPLNQLWDKAEWERLTPKHMKQRSFCWVDNKLRVRFLRILLTHQSVNARLSDDVRIGSDDLIKQFRIQDMFRRGLVVSYSTAPESTFECIWMSVVVGGDRSRADYCGACVYVCVPAVSSKFQQEPRFNGAVVCDFFYFCLLIDLSIRAPIGSCIVSPPVYSE